MAAGCVAMAVSVLGLWKDFLPLVPGDWSDGTDGWRWKLAHLTLTAGALLCVVGACRGIPRTRSGRWLERCGTPLAAFSYTLYLTHFPLLYALLWSDESLPKTVTWASLYRLAWWMAVCVGAALLLYALFERQTPRARRWLRRRLGGMASVEPGLLPGRDFRTLPADNLLP